VAPVGEREGRIPSRFSSEFSPVRGASEESSFRKAHAARPCDYEMVEHLNVDQGEGRLERARKDFVGVARLRYTRGVVVGEDDGGGVRPQRGLVRACR